MTPRRKTPPSRPPRLFAEPGPAESHRPETSHAAHIAHIDGAARGNPGPAAYGIVFRNPDGTPLESLGKYIGRSTNNVAEYYALIAALDYAAAHGIRRLRVRSDSELLVRQMHGRYKVKSADLRPLHERARKLAQSLAWFHIEHLPRERNREADALANAALDRACGPPATNTRNSSHDMRRASRAARRIRARYLHGALHPLEPLDLAENEEIEIEILDRS